MVTIDNKRQNQILDARLILDLFGARPAAEYLRKLGWSIEAALYILLGID